MPRNKQVLTVEMLRDAISYEPETGIMRWKVKRNWRKNRGDRVGTPDGKGYVQVGLYGRLYQAHRLAWFHYYGSWPERQIDHINGDKSDNRISNLRDVDGGTNTRGAQVRTKVSATGMAGAYRLGDEHSGSFRSVICVNRKKIHLGTYATAEAAHFAYVGAKRLCRALDAEIGDDK